jgi:putative addiction module component (TIGR02574 family)
LAAKPLADLAVVSVNTIQQATQMSTSELSSDFRSLPIAQRLDLVEQIWDSIIKDEAQFELSGEQKAELDRRLAEHVAAPDRGDTWANVKARLLGGK